MSKVYNLTIDRGNTAAKVSLWDITPGDDIGVTNRAVRQAAWQHIYRSLSADDIDDICRRHHVCSAIYSSVSETPAALLDELRRTCDDLIVLDADTPTPLTIGYRTPETLGVDRLAAAVGARSLPVVDGHELLIADIGTAITYDHVTADGIYLGGNIAPGIYMRLQALNHYTARLPLVEPRPDVPLWGDDTRSALVAGAVNGVVAELQYYRHHLPSDAITIVTGGAASLVVGRLGPGHLYVENLVGLGLDAIIRYNRCLPHTAHAV